MHIDFIIVNNHLHDKFDAFKRDEEIESECSYLRMNELLMYYCNINQECGHLQQSIVTRYGHTYLKLSGYDIDNLCMWIKDKRENIGKD